MRPATTFFTPANLCSALRSARYAARRVPCSAHLTTLPSPPQGKACKRFAAFDAAALTTKPPETMARQRLKPSSQHGGQRFPCSPCILLSAKKLRSSPMKPKTYCHNLPLSQKAPVQLAQRRGLALSA